MALVTLMTGNGRARVGYPCRTMRHSIFPLLTLAALLAGCASNPAPVVDHSLGSAPPPVQASAPTAGAASQPAGGEHANGEVTAQGYVVARGDTLYSIAFRNGMDYRALAQRNGIKPPYTIHPGQVLHLGEAPTEVAQSAPAPVAVSPKPSPKQNAPVFGAVETTPAETQNEAEASPSPPAPATTTLPTVNLEPGRTTATTVAPPRTAVVKTTPAAAASVAASEPRTAPAVTTPPLSRAAAGRTRTVDGIAWQWPADGPVIGSSNAGLDIAGNEGDPVRAAADGTVVYSGNGLIGYGELIIIKHSDSYLSAYGHNRKRLVQEGQHVRAGQQIAEMGSTGAPREELHFEIRKAGKPVDPTDYLPGR